MDRLSFLSNSSPEFLESQYQAFIENPSSVEESWRQFFDGFDFARKDYDLDGEIPENVQKEFKVVQLINSYRQRGHLFTKTNPVRDRRKYEPTLDIKHFGLDWPLHRIVCELMKRMILNLIRDDISVEQWLSDTYKIFHGPLTKKTMIKGSEIISQDPSG